MKEWAKTQQFLGGYLIFLRTMVICSDTKGILFC
jgi:hypothetical protein